MIHSYRGNIGMCIPSIQLLLGCASPASSTHWDLHSSHPAPIRMRVPTSSTRWDVHPAIPASRLYPAPPGCRTPWRYPPQDKPSHGWCHCLGLREAPAAFGCCKIPWIAPVLPAVTP